MSVAQVAMIASGLSAIVLGSISVIQPLSRGTIRSNSAAAEFVRRLDNPRRYWGLVQVRLVQLAMMMTVVNLAGSRFPGM